MSTNVREELLTCRLCGKKLGMVPVTSIGTPHQFIGEATCVDCLPKAMDEALKKHPQLAERVQRIREWLK